MGIDYSINTKIKLLFEQDNIEKILLKGIEIGFTYFDEDSFVAKFLNEQEASKLIFEKHTSDDEDLYPYVRTKYEDTYFSLWIEPTKEFGLNVRMSSFFPKWTKMDTLDFSRYIRILLKLLDDFIILELETETM